MKPLRLAIGTGWILGMLSLAWMGASQTKPEAALEYPTPPAREEVPIRVNGVAEVWQLRWKSPPKPVCEPSEGSLT
jgi:hypothetical protein